VAVGIRKCNVFSPSVATKSTGTPMEPPLHSLPVVTGTCILVVMIMMIDDDDDDNSIQFIFIYVQTIIIIITTTTYLVKMQERIC
jgi:hypothetical protein